MYGVILYDVKVIVISFNSLSLMQLKSLLLFLCVHYSSNVHLI